MSKLSEIVVSKRTKTVKLGSIEIDIRPLASDYIPLLMKLGESDISAEEQGKLMKEIVSITLKEAVPDATDDEVNQIGLDHVADLIEYIMDINKLDKSPSVDPEMAKRAKNFHNIRATGNQAAK